MELSDGDSVFAEAKKPYSKLIQLPDTVTVSADVNAREQRPGNCQEIFFPPRISGHDR